MTAIIGGLFCLISKSPFQRIRLIRIQFIFLWRCRSRAKLENLDNAKCTAQPCPAQPIISRRKISSKILV